MGGSRAVVVFADVLQNILDHGGVVVTCLPLRCGGGRGIDTVFIYCLLLVTL